MADIDFKIITTQRTVFEDRISQATLPVMGGQVTILPNHRSYIAALESGEVVLKGSSGEISLAVAGGFLEFHKNKLVILADRAEKAEEIDLERAEEARKRAEDLKKEKVSMDDSEYARVAAMIEKEMARIKVAKKHHTKRRINLK